MSLLQHVAVQRDHLQVKHTSRITKEMHWVVGGVRKNEILFVQIFGLY